MPIVIGMNLEQMRSVFHPDPSPVLNAMAYVAEGDPVVDISGQIRPICKGVLVVSVQVIGAATLPAGKAIALFHSPLPCCKRSALPRAVPVQRLSVLPLR